MSDTPEMLRYLDIAETVTAATVPAARPSSVAVTPEGLRADWSIHNHTVALRIQIKDGRHEAVMGGRVAGAASVLLTRAAAWADEVMSRLRGAT